MEILPDKIESNKIKEDSTKEYNEKQKNVDKRNRYKKIKNTKKNSQYEDLDKFYTNLDDSTKDDSESIKELKEKLLNLEKERDEIIKNEDHNVDQLTNIRTSIREIKLKIERLENKEKLIFPNTEFNGGVAVLNKENNKIQLLFDNKPNNTTIQVVKSNGFNWYKEDMAWQIECTIRNIEKTKDLIEIVLNKMPVNQKEEEEEFD